MTMAAEIIAPDPQSAIKPMRVLIACECSGMVRDAFLALGHDAWSCDLKPSESGGKHIQHDALDVLGGWVPVVFSADCDEDGNCPHCGMDYVECGHPGPTQDEYEYREIEGVMYARPIDHPQWDLLIAHPDCTYLTVSNNGPINHGCSLYTAEEARRRREEAKAFFLLLANADISHICIENPVGIMSSQYRKPDQIIQPWQFGDDASKKTCLWLKGLPLLVPTDVLPGGDKARRANQTPNGQNKLGPSPTRKADRARTYPGIAAAMAAQWGCKHELAQGVLPLGGHE